MANALRFEIREGWLRPLDNDGKEWLASKGDDAQRNAGLVAWLTPVSDRRARSLDQNALMWQMYGEIAEYFGFTPGYAHCFCKLHYGVPILRLDNAEFRKLYNNLVLRRKLVYEQKIALVEYLRVTSEFSVTQATEYIDTIIREMANEGLVIRVPNG
jgi:hypothetical protein